MLRLTLARSAARGSSPLTLPPHSLCLRLRLRLLLLLLLLRLRLRLLRWRLL
jgi:hypothetical protein